MFASKNLLNLLNKRFFVISTNGYRVFLYGTSSAVQYRHISNCEKKDPPSVKATGIKTAAEKLVGVLAGLDVSDEIPVCIQQELSTLSNNLSNSEKFIKIMKCEKNLDRNAVINILENYTQAKVKFLRAKKYKEEIRSSPEFTKFIQALKENVETLDVHDLHQALSCIDWFDLPKDHDLYTLIPLNIIDKLNDLTLVEAITLFRFTRDDDNDEEDVLKNELIEELKLKIEKNIENRIDNLNMKELQSVLLYLRENGDCEWPDEVLITLFNSCFNNSEFWKWERSFSTIYYMNNLIKDDVKKKVNQLKIILKLFNYMLKNDASHHNLRNFAVTYAYMVRSREEKFDEKLFNSVMDSVLKKKVSLMHTGAIVAATNFSKYIRTDVLNLMKGLLLRDVKFNFMYKYCSTKNQFFIFYRHCVNILACSEFQISSSEWFHLRNGLTNHSVLNDVNEWKDVSEMKRLRLAVALASLEVFPKPIVKYLSQSLIFNEEDDDENNKSRLLLALNQAVTLLNVDDETFYQKPGTFINENVLSACMAKAFEGEKHIPEKLKPLIKDIEDILRMLRIPFLKNVFTKFGHDISFMVAVNEKKYFNFRPLQVEGNPRYVEDVPVPSQFKTILVLPFSDNDYCRNWFTLPSHARLKVKTLEAMGYATTCILSDRWINLSTEGKKRFLVDEFKKFSE